MKTKVTEQEYKILMDAAKKTDAQGARSVGSNGLCRYRGPNGLKCFVGHMIPDEEYHSGLEGCLASEEGVWDALEGLDYRLVAIVDQCQLYHDYKDRWSEALKNNPYAMQDFLDTLVEVG
jgi:hypothetical protein